MKPPHWPLRPGMLLVLAAACAAAVAQATAAEAGWWSALGERDLAGARLSPTGKWVVVIFVTQDCPVSNASIPVLNQLASEFGPRGFSFIGAYVDPTATLASMRAHASDYSLGFAQADDRGHMLVKAALATYTPEVAVFGADGAKLYVGRIDDRVGELGASRPAATHQDLRDVLVALASGAKGPFEGKSGYGCAIPEAVHP